MKLAKSEQQGAVDQAKAIGKLKAEVANLTDAIATGALRASPALAARLETAERELARLEAESAKPARGSIAYMIPRFAQQYRSMIADLAQTLTSVSVSRARAEVRKLVGELRASKRPRTPSRSTQTAEQALMRLAGGPQQKIVVAGPALVLVC